MPEIGQLAKGRDIGKLNNYVYIYTSCIDCGKKRWVRRFYKDRGQQKRCIKCHGKQISGPNNYLWKGGRSKTYGGYIVITLERNSPFYSMIDSNGHVLEHRLIMAKHLGRCLLSSEIVHHLNGIRDDNRLENLEIYSTVAGHAVLSRACKACPLQRQMKAQESELSEMQKEIRLLRWQTKEQNEQIRNLTVKFMSIGVVNG